MKRIISSKHLRNNTISPQDSASQCGSTSSSVNTRVMQQREAESQTIPTGYEI